MLCGLFGFWCSQVDAYYYPNKSDLTNYEVFYDVGSVDDCRTIVFQRANENGDPDILRGDYECGIDPHDSLGSLTVYRETVR